MGWSGKVKRLFPSFSLKNRWEHNRTDAHILVDSRQRFDTSYSRIIDHVRLRGFDAPSW